MASIEKRGQSYRVIFRLNGVKYSRSLRTRDESQATAALARLEDTLRRVELGTIRIPADADPAHFLLSDGRALPAGEPVEKPKRFKLGQLFETYFTSLPEDTFEPTTRHCLDIHTGHLKSIIGENFALNRMSLKVLQDYVNVRAKATGRRGKPLSPTTIRKELATLNSIWGWGIERGFIKDVLPKKGIRFPKTTEKPPFQTIREIERKINLGGLQSVEIEELWDSVFLALPEIEELRNTFARIRCTDLFIR